MFKHIIKFIITIILTFIVYCGYINAKHGEFTVAFLGGALVLGINIVVSFYLDEK